MPSYYDISLLCSGEETSRSKWREVVRGWWCAALCCQCSKAHVTNMVINVHLSASFWCFPSFRTRSNGIIQDPFACLPLMLSGIWLLRYSWQPWCIFFSGSELQGVLHVNGRLSEWLSKYWGALGFFLFQGLLFFFLGVLVRPSAGVQKENSENFQKKEKFRKKKKSKNNPSSVFASKELGEVLRLGSFSVFCFRKMMSESS